MQGMKLFFAVMIMSLVTFLTRAMPFIFFRKKSMPGVVAYVGKYLPPALITIIIIYCLKDINLLAFPFGAPEMIASLVVVVMHLVVKNSMVSIFSGAIMYMFLVQVIFP